MSADVTAGPPHRGWTLLLASMGVFIAALDALVVATALPVLRIELGATRSDLEWTVNTYNLAFACMILTGRRDRPVVDQRPEVEGRPHVTGAERGGLRLEGDAAAVQRLRPAPV